MRKLYDVTKKCLLGLTNYRLNLKGSDPIILHLHSKKPDRTTHTLYEQTLAKPLELQKLVEFLLFLERRLQALETVHPHKWATF